MSSPRVKFAGILQQHESPATRTHDITAHPGRRVRRKETALNALDLLIAAILGVMVGLAGHAVVQASRVVSRLLAVTVGATAAVSGTIAAWLTGYRTGTPAPAAAAGPALFAAIAVTIVVMNANRPHDSGPDRPE